MCPQGLTNLQDSCPNKQAVEEGSGSRERWSPQSEVPSVGEVTGKAFPKESRGTRDRTPEKTLRGVRL